MKEPRPCVVGHKADGDVVCGKSNVDGVTLNRVEIVVLCCPGAPHDIKGVLDRLSSLGIRVNKDNLLRAGGKDANTTISGSVTYKKLLHTGVERYSVGKDTSMTLFGGRVYTVPWLAKAATPLAPLRICRRVGVSGGV